jgi:hypothetical protein
MQKVIGSTSSLINLPASAFNSSFPPPAIQKDSFVQNYQHQSNKRKDNKNGTVMS